jgi:hypothetical protein
MGNIKNAILGALVLVSALHADADTFETKEFRDHRLTLDKGRITCVGQASAWLGLNRTRPDADGIQIQAWTDPANDATLEKDKISLDLTFVRNAAHVKLPSCDTRQRRDAFTFTYPGHLSGYSSISWDNN